MATFGDGDDKIALATWRFEAFKELSQEDQSQMRRLASYFGDFLDACCAGDVERKRQAKAAIAEWTKF